MARPNVDTSWATEDRKDYIISPAGDTILVFNKVEPSVATKQNGVQARNPLIRPYLNYILNAIWQMVTYNNEGEVDDIFTTANTSMTVTEVQDRFGNVWTDLGTDTLSGTNIKTFRRTA